MSVVLGSKVTNRTLEMMLKSPNSNLMHEQSAMYVEVLWQMNYKLILTYSLICLTQFILVLVNLLAIPYSAGMMVVNAIVSLI